jgi:TolB protein
VDGVTETQLSATAPVVIAPLAAGDHQLELSGLPLQCAVDGDQPKTVTVVPGDTASVEFDVACQATAGTVQVTSSSEGEEIDPNGYRVLLDGTVRGDIPVAGALALAAEAGPHTLALGHLTANCTTGQNPRDIVVHPGGLTSAHFSVACSVAEPAGRGHELAFVTDREKDPLPARRGDQIYLMNEDGTGLRPLPSGGAVTYSHPTWSPDGSRLVLAGTDPLDFDDDLYLLDPSGGSPTLIPNTQGRGDPAWSPDGSRIAFIGNPLNLQIWTVGIDGSNPTPITSEPVEPTSPTWSPDGNRIAFTTREVDEDEFVTSKLVILDLRNSARVEAYSVDANIFDPAWSPDGTKIAFSGSTSSSFDDHIYILDLTDGSEPRAVSTGDFDLAPTWALDGSRIAFARFAAGSSDIYVVNSDGSDEVRLTDDPNADEDPAWRP